MKSLIPSLLLLASLLVSPFAANQRRLEYDRPASPERRIALVIGNSAYVVGRLRNPINDARAMAKALRELGFEVIQREDLGQTDMKRSIKEFGAKLKHGGVGLFYYAGHGVQVGGENYLIPVDAAPESTEEVKYEAVNAGLVLAQIASAGNSMNIMILDACRNNPFARTLRTVSDGLATVNAPSGTLIAYATAPGSVASDGDSSGNGIYTEELLKFIRVPGLSIEEVFKRVRLAVRQRTQDRQTPWESSSLTGDFFFTPAEAASELKAVELNPAVEPASPKTSTGNSNEVAYGAARRGMQVVRYGDELALAFLVHHIHRGSLKGKGCHGLLYVTQTRIIFEPTDSNHGFNQPRTQIKEARAGHISLFSDSLGDHLVIKYGDETKRFYYYCLKKEGTKGEPCSIPFADYLFNLAETDFEAATRKLREFVHGSN
jgi:hypothetical protein